jgi:hypothetical protein
MELHSLAPLEFASFVRFSEVGFQLRDSSNGVTSDMELRFQSLDVLDEAVSGFSSPIYVAPTNVGWS